MTEALVSILTVTYNRSALARECLGPSLERAGWPYELLSVDNGSTDDVATYIQTLDPVYHSFNGENLGYAKALNEMLAQTQAEYVCVVDPDLTLSHGWLHRLVTTHQMIENAGLSSIYCVQDLPQAQEVSGVVIYPKAEVYGVKFLSRRVIERIGYFYEGLGRYGNEDLDYNYRCTLAGLQNYYVSGVLCDHTGDDSYDQSEYRQFKWHELRKADELWQVRKQYLKETGDYYVPCPEVNSEWLISA
jgi:GT2 family glycosyltransferase